VPKRLGQLAGNALVATILFARRRFAIMKLSALQVVALGKIGRFDIRPKPSICCRHLPLFSPFFLPLLIRRLSTHDNSCIIARGGKAFYLGRSNVIVNARIRPTPGRLSSTR